MALAEYYERAALAASQIIAGFAPDLFRRTLEQANVGLTIDKEAATSDEGKALAARGGSSFVTAPRTGQQW